MGSSSDALTKIHVVGLVLLVLIGGFVGAFYFYGSLHKDSDLPLASSTVSPSPVPTVLETQVPSPTVSPSIVGDNYEPDNNFTQYSTFDNSTDTLFSYIISDQSRSIFPVGDKDYIRVHLNEGFTFTFVGYGNNIDTYASLYDADYHLLASNDNQNEFDLSFSIDYVVNHSGYYFLVVGANTTEGDDGAYRVYYSYSVTPFAITLDDAISQGLVQMTSFGGGLQSVGLSIESLSNSLLNITVTAGTKFQSQSAGVQSMVVLYNDSRLLKPNDNETINVGVACMNMNLAMPESTDSFTISHNIPEDLTKLLHVSSLRAAGFRVVQFAIWTITNNPSRSEFTSIGSRADFLGPSDAEMQSVQALFQAAGIDPQNYRAFQ
jgi:hypothetical protein